MKFKIEILMDTEAFQSIPELEVASLLREIAVMVSVSPMSHFIEPKIFNDVYGNPVCKCWVE